MSHTEEDLEKNAQAELFVKIASEQGIDLNEFSEEQVAELYETVFSKEASAPAAAPAEAPKADEAELLKAAEAEFAGNKEKVAEAEWADALGRRMAHSLVGEMRKIAEAEEAEGKDDKGKGKEEPAASPDKGEGGEADEKTAGAEAPAAAKVASASAIDELALKAAVKIASEGNFDEAEAEQRVGAVATLGGPSSEGGTKVASATSVEEAVNIRALEYLEAAGYPVNWE